MKNVDKIVHVYIPKMVWNKHVQDNLLWSSLLNSACAEVLEDVCKCLILKIRCVGFRRTYSQKWNIPVTMNCVFVGLE